MWTGSPPSFSTHLRGYRCSVQISFWSRNTTATPASVKSPFCLATLFGTAFLERRPCDRRDRVILLGDGADLFTSKPSGTCPQFYLHSPCFFNHRLELTLVVPAGNLNCSPWEVSSWLDLSTAQHARQVVVWSRLCGIVVPSRPVRGTPVG